MGLSSSPFLFNRISDFVTRSVSKQGAPRVINYLDDFAVLGNTKVECQLNQSIVISTLRRLGFYISYSKLLAPAICSKFLSIEVDRVALQLQLPADNIAKLRRELQLFIDKKKATRKELERLGSRLAHCSKVIRGGRSFSTRIYDSMCLLKKPYYKARLSAENQKSNGGWIILKPLTGMRTC